jgi:prolipoprotein diacylglyceryltransferase
MTGMLRVAVDAPVALVAHTLLEMTGIFVGMRVFALNARRHALGSITAGDGYAIALGCILGAIAGSKMAVWIDRPDLAQALWATPRLWLMGQSIVGALIGGLVGVEVAKRVRGAHASTGDAFVVPLALGIAIGRIGCFVAGLHDDTYGLPTALPWGVDFGDATPRHPTQLYDVAFVAAVALVLQALRPALRRVPRLAFKLFFVGYLAWRIGVDALKPVPYAYPGGLSGLQLVAAAALIAYAPLVARALSRLR